ncbi:MAG: hypothetical protein HC923_09645 [Myxococcales bacterium]|nr:hypothetical protein [Myxococcales bacterium]
MTPPCRAFRAFALCGILACAAEDPEPVLEGSLEVTFRVRVDEDLVLTGAEIHCSSPSLRAGFIVAVSADGDGIVLARPSGLAPPGPGAAPSRSHPRRCAYVVYPTARPAKTRRTAPRAFA